VLRRCEPPDLLKITGEAGFGRKDHNICNSGRTERAHCAKPKPFIDPGVSISPNTTSTGMLVFCKITMASSVLAASTAIAAVAKELHDGHADQDVVIKDEHGPTVGRLAVAVGCVHARCCALDN
jgi:hypothetical protein